MLLLAALVPLAPAWSAGGPGDGTTKSSWIDDPRLLDALVAIGSRDFPQAVRILDGLVADKPDFSDAWNYLGYALRKGGDLKRSERAYRKALDIEPEHRGAHEYLGELYLQTGRRAQAEALEQSLARICKYGCPELDALRSALSARP